MTKAPFEPSNPPDLERAAKEFASFVETVAALRDPVHGCPWDLEQDHESLRRFLVEECYEAADALAEGDPKEIADELGDVLLQIVLHGQLGKDYGTFDISDIVAGIDAKMRRRHPHVFGNDEDRAARTVSEIKARWKIIKQEEKQAKAQENAQRGIEPKKKSLFDAQSSGSLLPASIQAYEIGKRAKGIGFDWSSPDEVLGQFLSEVEELKQIWEEGSRGPEKSLPRRELLDEVGDLFFTLNQLCRHLGEDPEVISLDANRKFLKRFRLVEDLAEADRLEIEKCSQEQLEALWSRAKEVEKKNSDPNPS